MRRPPRAFTLVEVLAVVAVLALLAGAVAWSAAGDMRRVTRRETIGRIAHADHLARVEAVRLGRPVALRFDFNDQRIDVVGSSRDGRRTASEREVALAANCRIERVWIAGDEDNVDSTAADVAFSITGRSPTYAVKLSFASDGSDDQTGGTTWAVFCGLTGQATCIDDDEEIENLFATLLAGRPDAH